MASRLLENLSFGLTGGWAALTARHPDVIYANSWPILATGILFLIAKARRIPIVLSVQDVYPDSLVFQHRIREDGLPARLMRGWDAFIASRCAAVIAISERFRDLYSNERGVSPQRLHVVPNWGDSSLVAFDAEAGRQFRIKLGLPPKGFIAVYGGNVGAGAGVETLIEALARLKKIEDLHLIVAGQGSRLRACQDLAAKLDCDRVHFYAPWPAEETTAVLNSADVLILPTAGEQSLASVPSKLASYLLAARPIITAALPQSDIADMIRQSGAGWTVEPDNPDALASKLRAAMSTPKEELAARGKSGREFALSRLTRESCLPRMIEIIEKAANGHGR